MVYFFRKFSTDHDKDLVNYRKIKEKIISKMEVFREDARVQQMVKSGTVTNLQNERKEIQTEAVVEQFNNRPLKVSQSVMNMEKF